MKRVYLLRKKPAQAQVRSVGDLALWKSAMCQNRPRSPSPQCRQQLVDHLPHLTLSLPGVTAAAPSYFLQVCIHAVLLNRVHQDVYYDNNYLLTHVEALCLQAHRLV